MNAPAQGGWQERTRRVAVTLLVVAFALSFTSNVLRSNAAVLIAAVLVAGGCYALVLIARERGSRW